MRTLLIIGILLACTPFQACREGVVSPPDDSSNAPSTETEEESDTSKTDAATDDTGLSDTTATESATPDTESDSDHEGWTLVWAEEFDKPGLPSMENWSYDVGGSGWGNGESQYYTENRQENARIEDGVLIIETRQEDYGGMAYTSARLVSRNNADFLYGRLEVRAQLPRGRGTWPAIWMLPTDWSYGGWPDSGEIDIMEHVGFDPGVIHGTVHTKAYNHSLGTQKGSSMTVSDAMDTMHVYAIEWSADRIDFTIDGTWYFAFDNEHTDYTAWPFDQRFHFVLNIAVGGSWGGAQGIDDSIFPQQLRIDWVRVYQR